jgi:prevent-host-death family protein
MITVAASKFKAKLGVYMRAVREGKEIVVTDRSEPVARFVPFAPAEEDGLVVRPRDPAAAPLGELDVLAIRSGGSEARTLTWLREERARR